MKAINVLRGFLSESPSAVYPDKVLGFVDAIERELEEGYVELPKDADGEHIHLYDHLNVDGGSGIYVVGNMTCCTDGWLVGTNRGQIGRPEEDAHHYESQTVEDVMKDFAIDWDCADDDEEKSHVLDNYAKRLQLREGE